MSVGKNIFLTVLLSIGFTITANALDYHTVQDGDFMDPATWGGIANMPNIQPPEDNPVGSNIYVHHNCYVDSNNTHTNRGGFYVQPNETTTTVAAIAILDQKDVINYGYLSIINGMYLQYRFDSHVDEDPNTATNKLAGSYINGEDGGSVGVTYVEGAYIETAQDWANLDAATRTMIDSCLKTGQNFSISTNATETLKDVEMSVGWHNSGNLQLSSSDLNASGVIVQLAGSSGDVALGSSDAYGDFAYITTQNTLNSGGEYHNGNIDLSSTLDISAGLHITKICNPNTPYYDNDTGTALVDPQPVDEYTDTVGNCNFVSICDIDDWRPPSDLGDLPDNNYSTLSDFNETTPAENGARHNVWVHGNPYTNPYLGSVAPNPDTEKNGIPTTDAEGDDNNNTDDEDGVEFGPIIPGQPAELNITVAGECTSVDENTTCYVAGWMDFNNDGDFDDAGEKIVDDVIRLNGLYTVPYSVPAFTAVNDNIYARFRITTENARDGSAMLSTGYLNDGEVEDYRIGTLPVTISYVHPRRNGNNLDIDFTTTSESRNAGFNIYSIRKGKWVKLNDEMIPGSLDSPEAKDYSVTVHNKFGKYIKKIGIAGVDFNGREDRHGPFTIGKKNGVKVTAKAIDWNKIRKEERAVRKAKRAAKKVAKKTTRAERKVAKRVTRKLFKDEVVNLLVPEDGVYRVTHSDLLEAGIDLRGQKAKKIAISLKGEGIARHISGADRRGKWINSSAIEFRGEAVTAKEALYVSNNSYQLSLKKKLVVKSKEIAPDYTKKFGIEENNHYALSIPSDDPFYDTFVYMKGAGTERTIGQNFDMPKLPEGSSKVTVHLSALSDGVHHVILSLNGQQVADVNAKDHMAWPITLEVDNALFVEGSNKLSIRILNEKSGSELIVYDRLAVSYEGSEANALKTPLIALEDIVRKKELKIKRGTDYLIISHPMFTGDILNRYVKQRESEGWKIKVVNVEDIYDAYGYTMATPDAIKAYLEMAEGKGVTHVQLVGAASYDPHNYLGLGSISFIPSVYVDTGRGSHYTPSDTPYVMNKKGLPAMAIGRWPVRTLAQLKAVVNKTLAWEDSGQSSAHTALLIADKGEDFSSQMDQMAELFGEIANWTEFNKVYLSDLVNKHKGDEGTAVAEARSSIKSGLEEGASVMMFSGHSSTSVWSFKGMLKQDDIASIDNVGRTTLALPLACYTTYADSPRTSTFAHQMMAAGENGAVAIYGAAILSKLAENRIMATKVINGLLDGETLGEAVKNAKRSLGTGYRTSIFGTNLLGDVTLKLK